MHKLATCIKFHQNGPSPASAKPTVCIHSEAEAGAQIHAQMQNAVCVECFSYFGLGAHVYGYALVMKCFISLMQIHIHAHLIVTIAGLAVTPVAKKCASVS